MLGGKSLKREDWTDEKLFSRLLNNKSDRTYWNNIGVLRHRPTKEVFDKCIQLTFSEEIKARTIGIDVLAQLGTTPRPFGAESKKRFFELLATEKEPQILMSLLYAIGHNNEKLTKKQIDILCKFEDTNNSLVKEGLVNSLLGIDNSNAIDTLIKRSSDKLGYIRDWATFGLGSQIERNNKKIRAALWDRINDKHQATKYEAIVGLALRKDIRIKEILKIELHKADYGILLLEAITALGDVEFLPLLRRHYQAARTSSELYPELVKSLKHSINILSSFPNSTSTGGYSVV